MSRNTRRHHHHHHHPAEGEKRAPTFTVRVPNDDEGEDLGEYESYYLPRDEVGIVSTVVWISEEGAAPTLYCDCSPEERSKHPVVDGHCDGCRGVRKAFVYCLRERRALPRGTVTLLAKDGPCATYVVSSGPFGGRDISYTHCDGKSETVTHSTECRTVLVGKAPLTVCDPVDRATEGE